MASEDKYNKKKYFVNILGEEQVVVGDISEDYVNKLSNYINKVGTEITKAYPRLPRRRLVGLTLINMADEYFKLQENYKQKNKEVNKLEEENRRLKNKIKELKQENQEIMALLEEVE